MNINELQQQNTKNINKKAQSVSKISSEKQHSSDFSYYVEFNKNQEVSEEYIQNPSLQEENQEQNISQEELVDNQTVVYMQTVQALNNEIFDLGITDSKIQKFNFEDMQKYNINLTDLTLNDIKLFEGLTQQKTELVVNSFNQQNQTFNMMINGENLDVSYKSIEVSKTLFAALENAVKTGKSVRLDFGKDTSVILRIGKDGKLSADFVPNEKAMEAVLRNALPLLKAKLDEQNLPYGELNYKQYKQQNENQKQNKEKDKDE